MPQKCSYVISLSLSSRKLRTTCPLAVALSPYLCVHIAELGKNIAGENPACCNRVPADILATSGCFGAPRIFDLWDTSPTDPILMTDAAVFQHSDFTSCAPFQFNSLHVVDVAALVIVDVCLYSLSSCGQANGVAAQACV
jgi:hypothetical protein